MQQLPTKLQVRQEISPGGFFDAGKYRLGTAFAGRVWVVLDPQKKRVTFRSYMVQWRDGSIGTVIPSSTIVIGKPTQ